MDCSLSLGGGAVVRVQTSEITTAENYLFEDEKGKNKLDINNIMVVAPFNVQTNNIKQKLLKKYSEDTRVGTIDLFQGQEAKIVFISMTSSDAENLPRHKDFFFSRNRLNVAISRAQNVAIILFNPNLLLASANKIHEMRLMNNFCKLLAMFFSTNGCVFLYRFIDLLLNIKLWLIKL